jgi:thiol-disulfide isomerase/thioredoxin
MSLFSGLRGTGSDALRVEGHLPGFDGATSWLNSPPLTVDDLRGKVVLVQFWTFTCINWLRTLPYVRAWAEKYRDDGLVMVGVHTPEFDFERDVASIREAIRRRGIEYPVAADSDYAVWRLFANQYWPALYFADAAGAIRHHHFGEGEYESSERVIQALLAEAGAGDVDRGLVTVEGAGDEAAPDWDDLRSPETYIGYERGDNLASPGGAPPDQPHAYTAPDQLRLNEWALSGNWTVRRSGAELNEPEGRIAFRFRARDLHLVMGPTSPDTSVGFRVMIDGSVPGSAHGTDVDEEGDGVASERRLYQLVRQSGAVGEHTFEMTFGAPGIGAYVFTFG